jgi:FSR family fosmidomycin resistance protein-like MFS transporter
LPAVLVALGKPVSWAGGLMAVLIVGQTCQPAAGWLADRLGGRSLLIAGLLVTSVAGGLIGFAHSTAVLVVLLLAIGVGGAFFHPQALAVVRSALEGRHGLLTSVFLVGGELGRGLWPTVASFIVATSGLGALWVLAIPGLLTLPLLLAKVPKLPAKPRGGPSIQWKRHRRPLGLLVGYRSIESLATYALATFIPIMWHLRGGSLVGGASIITTMITVGVVGNLLGGHLSDRFGHRPVLVVAAVATAALTLPMAYVRGPMLWVVAALLGIGLFLPISSTILMGQDLFPENRSMGSGIALGFANGVGALLVFVIGLWVSDCDISEVLLAVAALALASVFLALAYPASLLRRPHHPDEVREQAAAPA